MLELHEVFSRARWAQNSPNTWLLKCTSKDGGWVLARAQKSADVPNFYAWSAMNLYGGWRDSRYAVLRAARKALRDAKWERAVSADDIQPGQMFVELADGSRWVVAR